MFSSSEICFPMYVLYEDSKNEIQSHKKEKDNSVTHISRLDLSWFPFYFREPYVTYSYAALKQFYVNQRDLL